MDGSSYGAGYGQPGWPYPVIAMASSNYGYRSPMNPYSVAYTNVFSSIGIVQGPAGPGHYGTVPQYPPPIYRSAVNSFPNIAEGLETYDARWYQGFYRGYEGEHGEEHMEQRNLTHTDNEELYGDGDDYDGACYGEDDIDQAQAEEQNVEELIVEETSAVEEPTIWAGSHAASATGLAVKAEPAAMGKLATAMTALNLRKQGISQLNPAAPTFLNPSAKTFVPPDKTSGPLANDPKPEAIAGEAAAATLASDSRSNTGNCETELQQRHHEAGDAGSSGRSTAAQEGSDEINRSNPAASAPSAGDDTEDRAASGKAAEDYPAAASKSLAANKSTPLIGAPSNSCSFAPDELDQQQHADTSTANLTPALKPTGACLPIPIPFPSASAGSSTAHQRAPRDGSNADALQHGTGLMERRGPKAMVQGSDVVKVHEHEQGSSSPLTMSDMRPISTPFRCFTTGLFSLFQGARGEYSMQSLWWCLDLEDGDATGLAVDDQARSPLPPSLSLSQHRHKRRQEEGHLAARVSGPYSCEQMILAYIAEALPPKVRICGTRGPHMPNSLPPLAAFQQVGCLLEAAEAGKPYELLQLPLSPQPIEPP